MRLLIKILLILTLISCSSISEEIKIKNELVFPKIFIPEKPSISSLKKYKVKYLKDFDNGEVLLCMNEENKNIQAKNIEDMELYIKMLEENNQYLRDQIKKVEEFEKEFKSGEQSPDGL